MKEKNKGGGEKRGGRKGEKEKQKVIFKVSLCTPLLIRLKQNKNHPESFS